MEKNPRITVVTVSYNSEKTIEDTIKSVLDQKYDNLDYVIVDGCSTDSTMDIVYKYRQYLNTVISEKDKGISDAFNKGIANADGDIIVMINSDDVMIPEALRHVAEAYDGKHDIYCGNVLLENPETGYKCREIPSTKFPVTPFFCHVAHQGMFVSRDAYRRFGGYNVDIRYPMDLDFLMRAYRMGATFKHVDYDIACFRAGGATSNSIIKKRTDYIRIVIANGGNIFQAFLFYVYLCLTQIVKHFINMFGSDISQKIRYRKTLKKRKTGCS